MGILGTAGSLYMAILIILLVLGFGLWGLWLVDYIVDRFNPTEKNSIKAKGINMKTK